MKPNKACGRGGIILSLLGARSFWLALLGLWGLTAHAVPPPAGVAPVVSPAGGFAIDGDLQANTPGANTGDWLPRAGGTGASVLDANGNSLNVLTTFHYIDPYNDTIDNTFVGGQKWDADPGTWQWAAGKASSKTDINHVLFHVTSDTNGHTWVIVAGDRYSTSGDSYLDFEFLQKPLYTNANGTFSTEGINGGRTTNDLVLSLAFTGGGSVPDFFAFRWVPNGAGGFGYVDATAALPSNRVFVAANSTTIPVPYGAFGQTNYVANAFAEAAVDLTALLGNFDSCLSIGIKTIMVKTRTSQSGSSTLGDFIRPIQYTMRVGPSANAGADQRKCSEGASTAFTLQGQATPGLYPLISTNWSIVSGAGTLDRTNSLTTTVHISTPTATLRLTVVQANGCPETDDVVLSVAPLPACSINGPASLCPRATAQYIAPSGMSGYAWTVAGNGSISGPTNGQTVTLISGGACSSNVTVNLLVTSNSCTSVCSTSVVVNDTNAPSLTCPSNVVLECPADTRTNVTGVATAQDGCGGVAIRYNDAFTNLCGGAMIIARTWTATDPCGNSTSAIQTISVRDTRPPRLTWPTNVVLECPDDANTNHTGIATAQDACGSAFVSYSDVVSNSCGGTRVITRTWTATDSCSNRTNAVQIITVRDTRPPSLNVPASVVLECPADTGTNNTGAATAADACGTVTIAYSDSVSNACGITKVITRLWTATDVCGNATNRLQTITVRDTTPPAILVPGSVVLECPADTSTNNTGVTTAQDACGEVTIVYSDVVSNSCGNTKTIWRTWSATDACGNSTNAVQTLTVRDTRPPSISAPPGVVLECPADISTNRNGVASALDACASVTITYSDSVSNGCAGARVVSRLWTAVDPCGNATNAMQIITVRDTTPPALSVPASVVLECPADISTNRNGAATALDPCSSVSITYSDSISNGCGATKVVSRLWTAVDACGNATNRLQTITVRDTTPPSLLLPANVTQECPGDPRTNVTGVPIVMDLCGSVALSYSDIVSNSCGGSRTIRRTWTAADACGNNTNRVQTITVRDTTPPALRAPANLAIECPGDTRTNVTGSATAPDSCSSVSISYSDIVSNSCGSTKTVWRNWVAADACGNTTNVLQTIVVRDTTRPSISLPNISVQCPDDLPAAHTNLAAFLAAGGTATDTCSTALTFSFISDSGLVGRCPGRVTRVYQVTDACGNAAQTTQTITVDDTTAPVIACTSDVTVECTSSLNPAVTGQTTATDNCSTNVVMAYTDTLATSQYSLNFFAADPEAGSDPTYIKLAPVSLPCPSEAILTGRAADPLRYAAAYGSTSGQLDAVTTLHGESLALGQILPFEVVIEASGAPGPEHGTIQFTANWSTYTTSNDRFGYDPSYMVYCAFVDYADPGTIDPNYNARVESFSSRLVGGGTSSEEIEGTFRVSGLESGDRVAVEIWVVLDSTASQSGGTVAAKLGTAQKATVPPEIISTGAQTTGIEHLSKIAPLPAPKPQPPPGTLPPQPSVLPGYTVSVVNRAWSATDDCANRSTCTQHITVRDTTPPAINVPANLVLEFPADTTTNHTGVATAPDACGSSTISYRDTVTNYCGGTKVVFRRWTATDGYSATNRLQTITVRDTTPPSISVPADVVLDCPADISTNRNGVATAQDANAPVTIVYNDGISNGCGGTKVVSRRWTATDVCGNSTNRSQVITVRDTTPPTVTTAQGANTTIECPAVPSFTAPVFTDACAGVLTPVAVTVTNTVGCSNVVTRTWTATDPCGNSTNRSQVITVRDTTPPEVTTAQGEDAAIECPAVPSFTAPVFTDACAGVLMPIVVTVTNAVGCSNVVTRTWTATDSCGNSTNRSR